MSRITTPLRLMGARITGRQGGRLAPLAFAGLEDGERLVGVEYAMPVASAQVKSALLLAGLYAAGRTTVLEPGPARDHSERMLTWMGAPLELSPGRCSIAVTRWLGRQSETF